METMTRDEALKILKDYQLWRKGKIDYFPISPGKLSQAIELAMLALWSVTDEYLKLAVERNVEKEEIAIGDKVTYEKTNEKGVVVFVNGDNIHVVFNCNNNWSNFKDYTAAMCHKKHLVKGWPKK